MTKLLPPSTTFGQRNISVLICKTKSFYFKANAKWYNSSVLYSSSLVSVISTWELLLQMLGRTCAARHSHTCALLFDGIFFVDVAHGLFGEEEALFSVVADGLRETIKSAFVGLQPGENMTLS